MPTASQQRPRELRHGQSEKDAQIGRCKARAQPQDAAAVRRCDATRRPRFTVVHRKEKKPKKDDDKDAKHVYVDQPVVVALAPAQWPQGKGVLGPLFPVQHAARAALPGAR